MLLKIFKRNKRLFNVFLKNCYRGILAENNYNVPKLVIIHFLKFFDKSIF